MNKPRLILAGGTGFLGQALATRFGRSGWEIIVLTRTPKPRTDGVREVAWDGANLGAWANDLEGATAVINLSGRSVDCRYTARNRRVLVDSRVLPTKVIGQAIARCAQPPGVWLNASS